MQSLHPVNVKYQPPTKMLIGRVDLTSCIDWWENVAYSVVSLISILSDEQLKNDLYLENTFAMNKPRMLSMKYKIDEIHYVNTINNILKPLIT